MRALYRSLFVALAVAAVPTVARAQDTSSVAARAQAARVLDHTFNAAVGEPVRVFLAKDVKYRVEVDGTNIQLQLRPINLSIQTPRVDPMFSGASATGMTMYTVTPHQDAEYEFISTGGDAMRPVNLHVIALPPKNKTKPGR
ncbi:MAG TPA: hypothetical protein VGM77_03895 [Gemmatimonadales bacterium]|jgi:hypothetical protein